MNKFNYRAKAAYEKTHWLYGQYVKSKTGSYMFIDTIDIDQDIVSLEKFLVDENTVGIQVPNIKDKNGNVLYTTDLVKFKYSQFDNESNTIKEIEEIGEIVYDESIFGFVIKVYEKDIIFDLYDFIDKKLELVGNLIEGE